MRSEGLSLQLSRRVNVVLIVVAAFAPPPSPLPPVCYFMPKTLTATAKSGRQWAWQHSTVATATATNTEREATKSGKFYGQQQQKLQYTVARTTRTTRTLLDLDWPWGYYRGMWVQQTERRSPFHSLSLSLTEEEVMRLVMLMALLVKALTTATNQPTAATATISTGISGQWKIQRHSK